MTTAELYAYFSKASGISTDSRIPAPGALFFALPGDTFDGNRFADRALEGGCAYAVVSDEAYKKDDRYIVVPDTLKALQDLAAMHRDHIKVPVIGVTGSNGKTTTKELLKCVLGTKYRIHATGGNLNNHIGVPVTILGIREDHDVAVVEIGANHAGEIAMLCEIAKPTHGVITSVGRAHLEGFGSAEGVLNAKSELYDYLKKTDGQVFVPVNDARLVARSQGMRSVSYGVGIQAEYPCSIISEAPTLTVSWGDREIRSHLIGVHHAINIACAIAVGSTLGVEDADIVSGIESYVPENNRSQIVETDRNTIILDAYNANPDSMRAGIEAFAVWPGDKKKVAIVGDMFELGSYAEEEHRKIVELLKSKDFDRMILVGPLMSSWSEGVGESFADADTLVSYLRENPIEGCAIFVKGSRGMRLETLIKEKVL